MHGSLYVSSCTLTGYIFYIILDSVTFNYLTSSSSVRPRKSKAPMTLTDRRTYLIEAGSTMDGGMIAGGDLYFNLENYFTDYFKNLVHVSSLSDY